jgi:hypothetical protein
MGRDGRAGGGGRRIVQVTVFSLVLALGLIGLAAAAIGVAHVLLPRQFTPAQQRQIVGWEMARRWRVLPAGKIFPAAVSYTIPALALNASAGLTFQAQRLAVSSPESCSAALSAAAASLLDRTGCSAALRATYVDASGSMVATVEVAVLPAGTATGKVIPDLRRAIQDGDRLVETFPVPGTAGDQFSDSERQLSYVTAAGPYVILSTAGFTDDRGEVVSGDHYVRAEMLGLADGLVGSARQVLGKRPPTPVCPGAPGC